MSLPGGTGFSGKQFWGIQLKAYPDNSEEKQVRVNADTELHISNVMVDVGYSSHQDNCSFSIGVRYEPDRCDCDITKKSCSSHTQQEQGCVICIIEPEKNRKADVDLNFVGGKDLTFYYSCNCHCGFKCCDFSVNISGYEVRG